MRSEAPAARVLTVVVQQLLDEVYVCKDHASAAVSLEAELRECVTLAHAVDEERQVGVPLVADYLAAGEAAYGNDLCSVSVWC